MIFPITHQHRINVPMAHDPLCYATVIPLLLAQLKWQLFLFYTFALPNESSYVCWKKMLFPKMAIFFSKIVFDLSNYFEKEFNENFTPHPLSCLQIGILLSYLSEAMGVVHCEQVHFSFFFKWQ